MSKVSTRIRLPATAIAVLFTLASCDGSGKHVQGEAADVQPAMAADAVYTGIYEEPIQLHNGVYEGAPFEEGGVVRPRVVLARNGIRTGDLDQRPGTEAAVLLEENSGGTDRFLYVAVLSMRKGQPVNIATRRIGDRVDIRSFIVVNHVIDLNVVEQGENDPACCPSQVATYRLALDSDSLKTIEHQITGKLSLQFLAGSQWRLVAFDLHEPPGANLDITLTIDSGQFRGSTGCNEYFAPVTEIPPAGSIEVGEVGATRKFCPSPAAQYAQRFLACLGSARQYSFYVGELAISWMDGQSTGTLLFAPVPDSLR
jgi:heat shock protein HslJ